MTHRLPLRMVVAVPVVAALVSCGGSPTSTGPAVAQQRAENTQVAGGAGAQSSPGDPTSESSGPPPSGASTSQPPATAGGGAPAGGGARAGGPAPGSGGGARPGGPFDVEAFENRGEDLAGFRTFGADHCAGGRCVLVERPSTDPDAQEGCEVADFAYDPPARPAGAPPSEQFIERGTTVTVFIHCPPTAGGSSAGGSGAAGSSSADSAGPDSSPVSDPASDPASGSSSAGAGG